MEPQYSAFADMLNKFHTAPMPIQALWLAALVLIAWRIAPAIPR